MKVGRLCAKMLQTKPTYERSDEREGDLMQRG